MTIRVGVIGAGYLGQHHARIYAEMDSVELAGVVDTDGKRAEEIAGRHGCRPYTSYNDMLGLCDALSIVTPTTTHHMIAMDCLKAGKDILIEKPITENIDEAIAVVREAQQRSCILQVGHLERYNPAIIAAAEMISEPRFVEAERLSPFLGRASDVDVTLDLMIHDVDIVISLVRAGILDIRATGESVLTDKIDVAKAWLEFDNGCKALLTAGRLSFAKKRTLKIFQKNSYLAIDLQNHEIRWHHRQGRDIKTDVITPEKKEPLREELEDFIDCVHKRTRPKVSGEEALNALTVVHRITGMMKAEGDVAKDMRHTGKKQREGLA